MSKLGDCFKHTLGVALLALVAACGGGTEQASSGTANQGQVTGMALALRPGEFGLEQSAAPIATLGEAYETTVGVGGGTAPYRFEVVSGTVPEGLLFELDTGRFHGYPAHPGRYDLMLRITDGSGLQVLGAFRLTVIEPDAPVVVSPGQATYQALGRSVRLNALDEVNTTLGGVNRVDAPLPGLVGLLKTIPEGGWVMANLNQFQDVWTPDSLRTLDKNSGSTRSPYGIIAAWSGFAWDSNRGDLILYGGGHAQYGGNDVYRWHGATRVWERASLPSEITQDALGNYHAIDGQDNAPSAAHTYDNSVFLPVVDKFLTFGGAAYNNGGIYLRDNGAGVSRATGPYLWDPVKGDPNKVGGTTGSHVKRVAPYPEILGGQMWQNRDIHLNLASTPYLPSSHVSGCTGYATEQGKDVVYVGAHTMGGSAIDVFRYVVNDVNNPSADSWALVGGYWDGPQSETVCAFDPVQRLLVRTGDRMRPFFYWNINTPATNTNPNNEVSISFTEVSGELMSRLSAGTLDMRNCGFDFDPVRRNYLLWCGGSDVWTLKPPASVSTSGWVLQKQQVPVGGTPTTAVGTGILGKWKYLSNIDAFMGLQDSVAGNVWLYKPYGWQPPGGGAVNAPPVVTLTAPLAGQTFVVGEPITLQATASDIDGSVGLVEFYDGTSKIGVAAQIPWGMTWTGAAVGAHTLTAVATDNLGASTASISIPISVSAINQAPSVTLSDPINGQIFLQGQAITLLAEPIDPEGQIAKVEFVEGVAVLATLSAPPWQHVLVTASLGQHIYSARVTDVMGSTGTSASVTVQVNPGTTGATTVVLQDGLNGYIGTRDSYLYSYWPTYNLGDLTTMMEWGGYSTPLVRFAIFNREGGPVPDQAVITSARLAIYKTSYYTTTLSAYRLICDWQEMQVTWLLCRTGVSWATPGATGVQSDYAAVPDGAGEVAWEPGSWLDINVTSGLSAMQNGAANYGWLLRRTSGDNVNLKVFNTRNYAINTSLRPKLTVSYTLN